MGSSRRRQVILNFCVSVILLGIVVLFADGGQHDAVESVERPPVNEDSQPAIDPAVEVMTEASEPLLLWEEGKSKLYVQDLQLYYQSGDGEAQALYEWTEPYPLQAWVNGEFVLIGTQLIDRESGQVGYHGGWLVIRVSPAPTILKEQKIFFGPQEVLSVALSEEPRLFFFTVVNGSSFSEYMLDPSYPEWNSVQWGVVDKALVRSERAAVDGVRKIERSQIFELADGHSVYSFEDEYGNISFYRGDFFSTAIRNIGYELVDVKRVVTEESFGQYMGWYRTLSGDDVMAYMLSSETFPFEPRLWEADWKALDWDNPYTFIRLTAEKLEVLRFKDSNYRTLNPPHYRQLTLDGGKLVSSKGTLLEFEFEVAGKRKYLSWYDVVNTADGSETDSASIWSVPLERYATREERRNYTYEQLPGFMVLEWNYDEYSTNAPLPDGYLEAVRDMYVDSDYSTSKTFRKIGSRWYVLVDRHFNEFVDGVLTEIGQWPVTISVETGEAFGGRGVRDFVRVGDYWFVADTEASRVLKLNDQQGVVAELAVPTPDQIVVEGEQLHIASLTSTWSVDLDLNVIELANRPFVSSAALNKVEYTYFRDQERYVDRRSGVTWYYIGGTLYQYHEKKQEFRSFYLGFNENRVAHVRIIPYGDEMLVVMDRRTERFDRQGNWVSTISYPRSRPDGIYSETGAGENSLYLDETSEVIYLVQGFRILVIDLNLSEVRTIFRQNGSDIGELIPFGGELYFMLHSSIEHRYQVQGYGRPAAPEDLYTEVVKIDLKTSAIRRFLVDEYYDLLDIESGSDHQPTFKLLRYIK